MNEDDAKLRFFILGAVRLASVALMAVGLAIIAGKLGLPREVGIAFAVFGLLELLLLPPFLARKWKSPRP